MSERPWCQKCHGWGTIPVVRQEGENEFLEHFVDCPDCKGTAREEAAMSECAKCGGTKTDTWSPGKELPKPCPDCGGSGEAGEEPKAVGGYGYDLQRIFEDCLGPVHEWPNGLWNALVLLIDDFGRKTRAEGVAQGRAEANMEFMGPEFMGRAEASPQDWVTKTTTYAPPTLSRRDEFAKAAMVELLGCEPSQPVQHRRTAKELAATVASVTDAVLAALDGKEE